MPQQIPLEKTAADFFAGIGLVTMGLEKQGWEVKFALDYSQEKRQMYEANFGTSHHRCEDIRLITANKIPKVTLAHASFPCSNISVAGSRGGINLGESSTFWDFIRLIGDMGQSQSTGKPPLILIENVSGLLTSDGGNDLNIALQALNNLGYTVDIFLIDAASFLPQSRVILFILANLFGTNQTIAEQEIILNQTTSIRPHKLQNFIISHPEIKWNIRPLPELPQRLINLSDIVDETEKWWSKEKTDYLFNQMFERHQQQINLMMQNQYWSYGTVFRRTRVRSGIKQSTAELRTDGIAGCLRTPKGGSARQIIIRAGFGCFDARLINARECASLMGATDYLIPENISLNNILFGFGDAVCVPVVEWIVVNYLNPLINEINNQVNQPHIAWNRSS